MDAVGALDADVGVIIPGTRLGIELYAVVGQQLYPSYRHAVGGPHDGGLGFAYAL